MLKITTKDGRTFLADRLWCPNDDIVSFNREGGEIKNLLNSNVKSIHPAIFAALDHMPAQLIIQDNA